MTAARTEQRLRSTSTPAANTAAANARRSRLAAATEPPIRPGPSTAVVAIGGTDVEGCITLANAHLKLDVAPMLGGGITRFDWRHEGALVPIFRPCPEPGPGTDPNLLACYPLLPYSNRIRNGHFHFSGRAIDVPRNREDEPCPLHGDGWLGAWDVEEETATRVRLSLDRSNGKPYSFRASQTYSLEDATLVVTLGIENTGDAAMPFGLGLHPFLMREADTELSAAAGGLWLCGDDWLPVRHVPAPPAWQFGVAYPMPSSMVNNAFTGWSGRTSVLWPKRRLSLTIAADTDYYVLYAPPGEDFFCFEPVDHPINAVNLPGGGEANGMTVLAPGERLSREFRFTVERTGEAARRGRPRSKAGTKARAASK
ncbi:aldose 1-epimerase [Caballeronia sp. BR00000012568055]|uniref:aldose 1-epimerase n=1 Tax=Caballeronia sp. BR00000012568055 TaxID=2918761 RepID=UPI0023F76CF0|nr:aldose 1-epimerase [Caballeronia sp. BR00000012568055]